MDGYLDSRLVTESLKRLAGLLSETTLQRQTSKEHLQRVIEELSTGMEELLVAEEELNVQAAQLEASTVAIDAERERYGELFEFAPDAYLVTDLDGRITEANSGASRMLGVPAAFLTGKLLVSFASVQSRRELRSLMSSVAAAPESVEERVLTFQARDGTRFPSEIRAVAHFSQASGETEIRWMLRDITERLEAQEELRFLHAEVDLFTSLASVARLTTAPEAAETLLDRVANLAAQTLPGCEVSVALSTPDGVRFPCTSGERSRRLDAAEVEQGDGPCLAAMRENEVVRASVAMSRSRWPTFAAAAEQVSLVEANGHPLNPSAGGRGALNVYAFRELSEAEHSLIPLLADQVVLALDNAELYRSAHELARHLEKALESRGVIEQAKGVLMARQGCSDDDAFDILRRASQRMNRKLRDVAIELVKQVQTHPPTTRGAPVNPADGRTREESVARAALLEERARSRAAGERHRADQARAKGEPAQVAMHEHASDIHERAADLQHDHQIEMGQEVEPPTR